MRHRKKGRRLGRTGSHRKALKQNLLKSLLEHGQIVTTVAKAKEYAPHAEKLITLAKKAEVKMNEAEEKIKASVEDVNSEVQEQIEAERASVRLAYFRRALSILQDTELTHKLFSEVAPKYADRPGGYTRVVSLNKSRIGDNAPRAVLALVEGVAAEEPEAPKDKKKKDKEKIKREKAEKKRKEKERKEREKEKERLRKEKEKQRLEKEKEQRLKKKKK